LIFPILKGLEIEEEDSGGRNNWENPKKLWKI
jgi:hypothetical protein